MNGEKAVFTPEMDAKRNGTSATKQGLSKVVEGLELGDVYGAAIKRIRAQAGAKPRLGMVAFI